ncbi:hypothetical protein BJX65DRAFT_223544 [Aspergillus insuetus]
MADNIPPCSSLHINSTSDLTIPTLNPNTADSPASIPAPTLEQPLPFTPQPSNQPTAETPTLNMANENTPTNQAAGGSHTPAADSSISASNSNPVRPGGAPARVYMNEKIVPYLLEGMKNVTKEQPSNPLRVLGEFLIQKSNEVEGGQSGKAPE